MPRVRYQKRIKAGPHVAGIATPVNTVLPVITGDTAGETSTTSDGTWTSADAFTYQWYLDGVLLAGETTNSIDTDEGWVGQTLSVVVCGGGGGGMTCVSALGVVLQEASAYTGPLDLVPGAVVAYGQRALSAAKLGSTLYTLTRNSDSSSQAFASNAVTGEAPDATITTFLAPFNKTGAVTLDDNVIVVTDASEIAYGQFVAGADIPDGAYVTFVDGNNISISVTATGTHASETIAFTPNGIVTTWNDQSANANNYAPDPFDYSEWQANKANTRPGIINLGSSGVTASAVTFPSGGYTVFAVVADRHGDIFGEGNGGTETFQFSPQNKQVNAWVEDGDKQTGFAFNTPSDVLGIYEAAWTTGSHSFKLNGSSITETSDNDFGGAVTSFSVDTLNLRVASSNAMMEVIIYPSKLSDADRLAIRQNIATYYGITL